MHDRCSSEHSRHVVQATTFNIDPLECSDRFDTSVYDICDPADVFDTDHTPMMAR